MWHRLPFAQKRKPAGYQPRVDRRVAARRVDRDSRRLRDARRAARDASVSAGTTSFRRCSVDVPAFAIERHDVTNERYPRVRRRRRLSRSRSGGAPEDWAWLQREARRASAVLGTSTAIAGTGAAMFELRPAAAGVAGLRQPGGGVGVRALARRAAADRSGVPARGLRIAGRRARRIRGATPQPDAHARRVRFLELGSRSRPAAIRRARAPGASRISSATAGNGRARRSRRSPASRRWRRIRNTRPTSSTASTSS